MSSQKNIHNLTFILISFLTYSLINTIKLGNEVNSINNNKNEELISISLFSSQFKDSFEFYGLVNQSKNEFYIVFNNKKTVFVKCQIGKSCESIEINNDSYALFNNSMSYIDNDYNIVYFDIDQKTNKFLYKKYNQKSEVEVLSDSILNEKSSNDYDLIGINYDYSEKKVVGILKKKTENSFLFFSYSNQLSSSEIVLNTDNDYYLYIRPYHMLSKYIVILYKFNNSLFLLIFNTNSLKEKKIQLETNLPNLKTIFTFKYDCIETEVELNSNKKFICACALGEVSSDSTNKSNNIYTLYVFKFEIIVVNSDTNDFKINYQKDPFKVFTSKTNYSIQFMKYTFNWVSLSIQETGLTKNFSSILLTILFYDIEYLSSNGVFYSTTELNRKIIGDMFFIENKESKGKSIEIILVSLNEEVNGKNIIQSLIVEKYILNNGITKKSSPFLVQSSSSSSSSYILSCLPNYSFSNNECLLCNDYIINNSCVKSGCSDSDEIANFLGYCPSVLSIYELSYKFNTRIVNNQIYKICDGIVINDSCMKCSDIESNTVKLYKTCVSSCPEGYYIKNKESCELRCDTGLFYDKVLNSCVNCNGMRKYDIVKETCVDDCSTNFRVEGKYCVCPVGNKLQIDPPNSKCISSTCEYSKKRLFNDEESCVNINNEKIAFDGKCGKGYFLNKTSILCSKCEKDYYIIDDSNTCKSCPEGVLVEESECKIDGPTCIEGYYFLNRKCAKCDRFYYDSKCVDDCSIIKKEKNFYVDDNKMYKRCVFCNNMYLIYNENRCEKECPYGYNLIENLGLCENCSKINFDSEFSKDEMKCIKKSIEKPSENNSSSFNNTNTNTTNTANTTNTTTTNTTNTTNTTTMNTTNTTNNADNDKQNTSNNTNTTNTTNTNINNNSTNTSNSICEYFYLKSKCIEQCPEGYFAQYKGNQCRQCIDLNMISFNKTCIHSCNMTGYYLIESTNECVEENNQVLNTSLSLFNSNKTESYDVCICPNNKYGRECQYESLDEYNNILKIIYKSLLDKDYIRNEYQLDLNSDKDLLDISQAASISFYIPEVISVNKDLYDLISLITKVNLNGIILNPRKYKVEYVNKALSIASSKYIIEYSKVNICNDLKSKRTLQEESQKSNDNDFYINDIDLIKKYIINAYLSYIKHTDEYLLENILQFSSNSLKIYRFLISNDTFSYLQKQKFPFIEYNLCDEINLNQDLYEILFKWRTFPNITSFSNINNTENDSNLYQISPFNTNNHISLSAFIINSNKTIIDYSSKCNSSFVIKSPMNISNDMMNKYYQLKQELGVDIFNASDPFFTDICIRYIDYNADFSLSKRRETFNSSIQCQGDCKYKGIDDMNYTLCDCNSMEDIGIQFTVAFLEGYKKSNIKVITCYNLAFDKTILPENIGFWFLTMLTIIAISIALYCIIKTSKKEYITQNLEKIIYNDASYKSIEDPEKIVVINTKPSKVGSPFDDIFKKIPKDSKSNKAMLTLNENKSNKFTKNEKEFESEVSEVSSVDDSVSKRNHEEKDENNIRMKSFALSIDMNKNNEKAKAKVNLNLNQDKNNNKESIDFKSKIESNEEKKKSFVNTFNSNKIFSDSPKGIKGKFKKDHIRIQENNKDVNLEKEEVQLYTNPKFKKISFINPPSTKEINNYISKFDKMSNDKIHETLHRVSNKTLSTFNFKSNQQTMTSLKKVSLKDLTELTIDEQIKTDNRGFWKFFKDRLMLCHSILILFKYSLIEPLYIRHLELIFSISSQFALNAIFFNDDYINQRTDTIVYENKDTGFLFTLANEFSKSIISTVITFILSIIGSQIKNIQEDVEDDFNKALISENYEVIIEGHVLFRKKMKIRFFLWIIYITTIHLFSWYYVICFCAVYTKSSYGWLYGCIISLIIDIFFFEVIFQFILSMFRIFAFKFRNTFCKRLYTVVFKIVEFVS